MKTLLRPSSIAIKFGIVVFTGFIGTSVPGDSYADEPVKHSRLDDPSCVSLGLAYDLIKTGPSTTSTGTLVAGYRQPIGYGDFTWTSTLGLLFKEATSFLGVSLSSGLGYRLFGTRSLTERYVQGDTVLLQRSVPASAWAAFADLTVSVLPIFGQTTTTTYSGPSLSVTASHRGQFSYEIFLHYSSFVAGAKRLTETQFGASYPFDL